jgi:hypothetical protein
MRMLIPSRSQEGTTPWRAGMPVPVDATWHDVWLTVAPIWAVLASCRVVYFELERLRFPADVPPVLADAVQVILLYPLVVFGCYLTLRVWRLHGFTRAWVVAALSTLIFGLLACPAYAVGSLLNIQDTTAGQVLSFRSVWRDSWYSWLSNTVEYGVLYLCCMAAMIGYFSYVALRHERRVVDEVAATAGQERLRALRAQVNPHFLFNSLNSIVSLSDTQPAAQLLVTQLSDLLRRTLQASEKEEHELFEELTYVEEYLDIELTRQPARLDWRITVEPGCVRASVPVLILIPLVENAVTHGMRGGMHAVAIEISVLRARGQLFIYVGNNCSDALPPPDVTRQGFGLRNVRARLEILFGQEATFVAGRVGTGRFEVQISVPLRELSVRPFREGSSCAS